jgi:hypothetical protein
MTPSLARPVASSRSLRIPAPHQLSAANLLLTMYSKWSAQ